MDQLIKDLLSYARVTKATDASHDLIDLNLVLEKPLLNLQLAIKDNDARITHGPLPKVFTQEIRIQQLLKNLIGNAIKGSIAKIRRTTEWPNESD
jgi:light-regulated signal transduction histidine kinase (bacteriophytochrome)